MKLVTVRISCLAICICSQGIFWPLSSLRACQKHHLLHAVSEAYQRHYCLVLLRPAVSPERLILQGMVLAVNDSPFTFPQELLNGAGGAGNA